MHNVLVTGGSRGIGLAIAQRIAGARCNLILEKIQVDQIIFVMSPQ